MTLVTLFLVLNPAVVAAIWRGYEPDSSRAGLKRELVPAVLLAGALLGLAVLAGEPLLDALDVSDSTFSIAAGALVIFGALQAFLGFGLRHAITSRTWLIVALLVWLVSPPALAASIALRTNEGVGVAVAVVVASVGVAVVLGYGWHVKMGARFPIVLGLVQRFLAAAAAFAGVELIRQGVLSI